MVHVSWSWEEAAPISGTWGFLVWPSSLKRSDQTSLRVLITALLSASSFVSFIYFLYCTQREHSVPAPGTHCSFPLDDLHMCSWKIILKTSGGGEWKEKKIPWVFGKIAWNLLWHLIVFSLSSPYTNQSEAMTSGMGSAGTTATSTGALQDGMQGWEGGIPLSIPAGTGSQVMGSIPCSSASSGLPLRVTLFLSHLSFVKLSHFSLSFFFSSFRKLRSPPSRSHSTDVSTHLCSIPHLGMNPLHGPHPPTRQSSNANTRRRTSGAPQANNITSFGKKDCSFPSNICGKQGF